MQFRLSEIRPGYILLSAGLLRLAYILISARLNNTEYWEYGQIAMQLLKGNGYSFPFTDENLHFLPNQFYPSALMPPGYVFFLLPFMLISGTVIRNLLLFSFQTFLALLAMKLVFHWSEKRLGKAAALVILLLQAFYPELIYAIGTVGPTVWFHFLFAGLLYSISEKKHFLVTGMLAGFLILMRSEAILPAGLLLLDDFLKGRKQPAILAGIVLIACTLPWLIRNQLQFGKPVLSSNFGVNFFRGNNAGEIGDWPIQERLLEIRLRSEPATYEQKTDSLAMAGALNWISENPGTFLRRLPEKFLRFWCLDWPDKRTLHWLYAIPWILMIPAGLAGLLRKSFPDKHTLIILFSGYTLIVLLFFPQVRYQTLIKFFWLIPAGAGLVELWMLAFPERKFLSSQDQ